MEKFTKIQVNLEDTQELITFIQETKNGKYTNKELDPFPVAYKRIDVQGVNQEPISEDLILYGTSY